MPLPTPTLHTPRLRLRPFAAADAGALYALQSNARVLRYWDAPPWTDPARAEAFLASCRQMEAEGSGTRVAIETREGAAFIGWCTLFGWNPVHRKAGLGYCLDDTAWGRGYATEAVHALLRWAFDTLDLNRVEAELDTRNAASARVLDKLGFVREGLRREDCVVSGEVSDSWIHGLLRRDWQAQAQTQTQAPARTVTTPPPGAAAHPADGSTPGASRHLALVSLLVQDYDAAIAFYRDALGFALVEDTRLDEHKRWVVVRPSGAALGPAAAGVLLARATAPAQTAAIGRQTGGRVFLFLHTDDIDRDHRLYRSRGVRFVREPADQPYGRVAVFEDLHGNLWDLVQPR
ncbi:GNAT family N-acetyltransferase [Piscinibacter sakaiensis]|uniref:Glyoxalase family protein n=1 Tax=Piscinibacter sakaiensis TaxID=1547922 RepID=A0A0K8P7N9_PISS1|nr:GNAT family N-acetyltransferase [Piscinibacter sakaiensis]GAP38554.1 glyoxalase family protein [Piscinibacter sakaiensis]